MRVLKYKEGYKYQTCEKYSLKLPFKPPEGITADYISLTEDGVLRIAKGYAWDGASCFPDLETILRPSLVHDALYQLMREKLLPQQYRDKADRLLQSMCIQCGMSHFLAWSVYQGVKWGGKQAASPNNKKKIKIAK